MNKIYILIFCSLVFWIYGCVNTNNTTASNIDDSTKQNNQDYNQLQQLCDDGNAKSCSVLAKLYGNTDLDLAIRYDIKACSLEYIPSCIYLQNNYLDTSYQKEIIGHFKTLCDKNNRYVFCSKIAQISCHNGAIKDCVTIADLHYNKQEYDLAFRYYTLACDSNKDKDYYACFRLGYMYTYAQGTGQDYKKAFEYDKESCENGLIYEACNNLGMLYEEYQDFAKAVSYFKMACDNNNIAGCENLAVNYYLRQGMQNFTKANQYHALICNSGDVKKCSYIVEALHSAYESSKNLNRFGYTPLIAYAQPSCQINIANLCWFANNMANALRLYCLLKTTPNQDLPYIYSSISNSLREACGWYKTLIGSYQEDEALKLGDDGVFVIDKLWTNKCLIGKGYDDAKSYISFLSKQQEQREKGDEKIYQEYLKAKKRADQALQKSQK